MRTILLLGIVVAFGLIVNHVDRSTANPQSPTIAEDVVVHMMRIQVLEKAARRMIVLHEVGLSRTFVFEGDTVIVTGVITSNEKTRIRTKFKAVMDSISTRALTAKALLP